MQIFIRRQKVQNFISQKVAAKIVIDKDHGTIFCNFGGLSRTNLRHKEEPLGKNFYKQFPLNIRIWLLT